MEEPTSQHVPDHAHLTAGAPSTSAHTATFLFTDIEGSTRLWEEQRDAMAVALAAHDALLRSAVEDYGGQVVKTTGDGMLAAFDRADAALAAAIESQRELDGHPWPTSAPLHVRMAVHTGAAEVRDGDFFGPTLNRAARMLALGHGGQVLVSGVTAALSIDALPQGSELIDRGEHLLRDLDRPEHVYQLAAPGLRREFPPLRSVSQHESNLPQQATSFVGRERELAEVSRLLETARLVTLVGVGGTGKTRLSLQVAAGCLDRHRDGAWLVELAPLSDPGLVEGAIARALGVQEQVGRPVVDTLTDFLRAKELLLVVDNCEHLIAAAAEVAELFLASCPSLRLIATSREPLGVAGEAIYAVPSLGLPQGAGRTQADAPNADSLGAVTRSEAVQLFVERARATLPSFDVDAENAASVAAICRRLDGIPLAIELAAARVNVLSPAEIAQGLDDRFRLLTGGRRTAVPRQRTLQGLIDWSWDLLDDEDRRLLRRLSVFAGGWTLDAAAAVTTDLTPGGSAGSPGGSGGAPGGSGGLPGGSGAGAGVTSAARLATLDGLGRLVDRSLVLVDRSGATRYRMLETIRQYAADRLAASGETAAFRDRHLALYSQLALDVGPGLKGPDMVTALGRLDEEIDNLRTALDWAMETDPARGLRMCVAMVLYWHSRVVSEGADRMLRAAEVARRWRSAPSSTPDAERTALLAEVLAGAAWLQAVYTGQAGARPLEDEALAVARESGDAGAIANTVMTVTFARVASNGSLDPDGPQGELAREAVRLAEENGDWYIAAIVQAGFGMHSAALDPAAAHEWLVRAGEAARRSGNPFVLANFAHIRGREASLAGQLDEARRWLEEAAAQFRTVGDDLFQLVIESEIAHALRRAGRLDEAEAAYRRTICEWQRGGNRGAIAHQLESLAFLALARGDATRSARLLGAAEALREAAEANMTELERHEYAAQTDRLRDSLGPAAFDAAWSHGRGMSADEAVALALSV